MNPDINIRELNDRLRDGKYTGWAENLSEQTLEALIWMLGEYGKRAECILETLDNHKREANQTGMFPRARQALEIIKDIVRGEKFDDVEVALKRFVEAFERLNRELYEKDSYCHACGQPIPKP